MAFFRKFFVSSLLSGSPALSISVSNSFKSFQNLPIDSELILNQNLNSIFKDLNNQDQKIPEFLKNYLKTTTGAYDLAGAYIRSLLLDLGENWDSNKSSDFITTFKQNLSAFSSVDDKLLSVKQAFIESVKIKLNKELNKELNNSSDPVFDFSKSNDEGLKHLNDFFQYLIEDYVKYKKPIFFKHVTWKYSDKETKIKEILESENISKNPSPSYFYPFSTDSNEKFKSFIKSVEESKEESYSDTPEQTFKVLSLNTIDSPQNNHNYSSQFIIAFLELHGHLLTHEKWKNSSHSSLSKTPTSDSDSICSDSQTDSIVSIKVDKIKEKTLSDVFCLNKENLPLSKQKPHKDFFYLKHSNPNSNPKNWIVFKDVNGFHALGIDYSKSKTETKELLKNLTEKNSKYKFDFVNELISHLSENFERILLKKPHVFLLSKDIIGLGVFDSKISPYLQFILDYTFSFNKLKNLRNVLIRDYLKLLKDHKPEFRYKSDNKSYGLSKIPISLGFAGAFPYKPNNKHITNSPSIEKLNLVFDYLELIYMSEFKKIKSDKLNVDSIFNTSLNLIDYSKSLDEWSYLKNESNVEYDEKQKVWKYSESNSFNSSEKNILNYILIKLQKDSFSQTKTNTLLINLALKESLKSSLNNENDTKDFKFEDLFSDITKDSFDGKVSEDIKETIKRRFLLDKYINLSNSYSHPALLESPIINEKKDLKDLTDRYKKLRSYYSPELEDLLSLETKTNFLQFLALKHLIKNKLSNYRLFLKSKLEVPRSSGFIYVKKIASSKNSKQEEIFKYDEKSIWELNNPYLGYDSTNFSPNFDHPTELADIYKFTVDSVDSSWSNVNLKVGYEGLYIQEVNNLGLPEEIQHKLNQKLNPITKTTVASYIKNLQTHHALDYFISKLEKHYSSIRLSEILKLVKSSMFNLKNMSLEQKKKIILGYLNQQQNQTINTNANLDIFKQKITKWLTSDPSEINLLSEDNDSSGYIENIETKRGDKYSVFYHKFNIDSLTSEQKFLDFIKKLPSDLICANLIDLSKQKDVQQQALWELFNGTNSNTKKWLIYDENLKNIIDFQFRKVK